MRDSALSITAASAGWKAEFSRDALNDNNNYGITTCLTIKQIRVRVYAAWVMFQKQKALESLNVAIRKKKTNLI